MSLDRAISPHDAVTLIEMMVATGPGNSLDEITMQHASAGSSFDQDWPIAWLSRRLPRPSPFKGPGPLIATGILTLPVRRSSKTMSRGA